MSPGKNTQAGPRIDEFFPEEYIKRAVKVLKLISEESKLRIMLLLAKEGECRVTDIAEMLGLNQTTLSHHLSRLRDADLVVTNREGTSIYYDINDAFWREMGREFFDYLEIGDNIPLLGKFLIKRLSH